MKNNLKNVENNLLAYKDRLNDSASLDGFETFQLQRDMLLGAPLKNQNSLASKDTIPVIETINFIKSLNFFSAAYIDNLIMYFVALANPVLGSDYLVSIIDRYIRPEGRSRQKGALKRLVAGYFIYCTTRKNLNTPASVGSASRVMSSFFDLDEKVIKNAYTKMQEGLNRIQKNEDIFQAILLVLSAICFFHLYEGGFDLKGIEKEIAKKHHHTIKEYQKLKSAFQEVCNSLAYQLIKELRAKIVENVEFFSKVLTPDLLEKISSQKNVDFETHEIAGLFLAKTILTYMPNIIENSSIAKELNFLSGQ